MAKEKATTDDAAPVETGTTADAAAAADKADGDQPKGPTVEELQAQLEATDKSQKDTRAELTRLQQELPSELRERLAGLGDTRDKVLELGKLLAENPDTFDIDGSLANLREQIEGAKREAKPDYGDAPPEMVTRYEAQETRLKELEGKVEAQSADATERAVADTNAYLDEKLTAMGITGDDTPLARAVRTEVLGRLYEQTGGRPAGSRPQCDAALKDIADFAKGLGFQPQTQTAPDQQGGPRSAGQLEPVDLGPGSGAPAGEAVKEYEPTDEGTEQMMSDMLAATTPQP